MVEELKELPPYVMISEAAFVAKQLNPAFEEQAKALAADVLTFDKAQTLTLMNKVLQRLDDKGVLEVREEIKEPEFLPYWEALEKFEEEKDPVSFDQAKECVLRYAVFLKWIPTRLATALELYSEELTQPERQIYDFFGNESLSDVTIIHPTTGATYKAHRMIVASGSRYMLEAFSKHSVEDLPRIQAPEPFNQKSELHSDDQVSRILKYIYGNQQIAMIRDEINEDNFYSLYAQAFALGCERLLVDLRELAVTSLLNEVTVMKLYNDAVEHQETEVMEACTALFIERFEEIIEQDAAMEQMLELNFDNLVSILKSDKLNLLNEGILVELVRKYIELRDVIPQKKPESAEEKAGQMLWELLTDTEKLARTEAFTEENSKVQESITEALAKDAEAYFAKDVTDRLQHVLNLKQKANNDALKLASDKIKLTDEEKLEILKCIRYSFLTQEELLKLSTDAGFTQAKEFIMQGLAVKLGGAHQFNSEELKINAKPRKAQGVADPSLVGYGTIEDDAERDVLSQVEGVNQNEIKLAAQSAKKSYYASNMSQRPTTPVKRTGPLQMLANQPRAQMAMSMTAPRRMNGAAAAQSHNTHAFSSPPSEFFFDHNFDEKGALYYLGSLGKRRLWQNPHALGLVQAFSSSMAQGSYTESFVGRSATNCRTEDEAFSFMGVDIGRQRLLMPTFYSIRNWNQTSHILKNWKFEGSVDGVKWDVLDVRIYQADSYDQEQVALDNEHKDLRQKGGSLTFQIDTLVYSQLSTDGYRFFRIVQLSKNSHGSDRLCLSGFELYGKVQGQWQ